MAKEVQLSWKEFKAILWSWVSEAGREKKQGAHWTHINDERRKTSNNQTGLRHTDYEDIICEKAIRCVNRENSKT